MVRDISVQCGTAEHDSIKAVALVLVFLWPVGMMLLFSFLLYRHRRELMAGKARTAVAKAMRLLTGGYKLQYYYWEIVELIRMLPRASAPTLAPPDLSRMLLPKRTAPTVHTRMQVALLSVGG